jgi:hypothetical protein
MRRAIGNLALLILLGSWILAWMSRYTDWLAVVLTLLGFGGLLTWTAFVGNSLPEAITQGFRRQFYRILRRPGTRQWLVGALALSLVIQSFIGAIRIRSTSKSFDAPVRVYAEGSAPEEAERFPDEGQMRVPVATVPFWGRAMRVKAEGYPDLAVRVYPFFVEPVVVPDSLRQRRVILLLPAGEFLANSLRGNIKKFTVSVAGKSGTRTGEVPNYHGEPLWIGCGRDVRLPDWTIALIADHVRQYEAAPAAGENGESVPAPHVSESEKLVLSSPRCPEYRNSANCEFDLNPEIQAGKGSGYNLTVSYSQPNKTVEDRHPNVVILNQREDYAIAICR